MNIHKQPPNFLDSERQIIGFLLSGNQDFSLIANIKEEWFYNKFLRYLFNISLQLFKNNIEIDVISISQNCDKKMLDQIGGLTSLINLKDNFISKTNLKYHIKQIKEAHKKRLLIKECNNALESLYTNKSSNEIISNIENLAINILDDKEENKIFSPADLMKLSIESIKEAQKRGGKIKGFETGLNLLDEALNGIQKKDLYIIGARPSMGKTAFAINICEALSEKCKVAFFSLEMSAEKISNRIISMLSFTKSDSLAKGKLDNKELNNIARTAQEFNKKNNFYLFDESNLNMQQIKALCKNLKLKIGGLDVIFIDHLGLINPDKAENRNLEISQITRQCKIIAKELNIAVVLLSQLSRLVEQRFDHRPMLSDLRESGSIEQDADTVMFLYRDEYYNKDTENKNVLEINIAKNRDGKTGKVFLFCEMATQKICNLGYLK